nr:HAMP domain-containing sensor histidine kinase [Aerococcus agrisoli]
MAKKIRVDENRKQRIRYFFSNIGAFAIIFIALGIIVMQILNITAYSETNISLQNIAEDTQLIREEIDSTSNTQNTINPEGPPNRPGLNRFNSQIILWNEDGTILNQEALGDLYNQITTLELDTSQINEIHHVELTDSNSDILNFQTITIEAPTNTSDVAYVTILANTNQIESATTNFKRILILSLVFFWLVSIAISYYLTQQNMKPIMKAWRKQQAFVENASHELRTPLTIIQNSLENMFTHPNHTVIDESENIAQALNETRRLTGLTTDLLTIARSDANEQTLDLALTDIGPFINEVTKPFFELANVAGKTLTTDNEAKAIVKIDQKKIRQVMIILLDNALKYTEAGDQIHVISRTTNKHWYIEVENTGASISDEDKERIFERFYRDDHSRASDTGGYGLGLAIAKQIVEDHQGQISAQDIAPQGVRFQIRLSKNYD